jgi:hypothetical protein
MSLISSENREFCDLHPCYGTNNGSILICKNLVEALREEIGQSIQSDDEIEK